MDEEERQRRFRETDEANTARRAAILGARYRDMRGEEDAMPLAEGVMDIADMYKSRIVPLVAGDEERPTIYGVTLGTPGSLLKKLNDEYAEKSQNVRYDLISDSAFRALMRRYDPPPEIIYNDVEISREGDSDTIAQVSKTLDEVRADDILNYLITQADSLGASDIHLENQRRSVRVRFRIDGTLHPIATLSHEKYRILFSSIASAANLSTAAVEAQSGHIVRDISDMSKDFRTARERNSSQSLVPNFSEDFSNNNAAAESSDFAARETLQNQSLEQSGEKDFRDGGEIEIQNDGENIEHTESQGISENPGNEAAAPTQTQSEFNDNQHILNMRIETVPTSYGQDAVIRLFNFSSNMLHLDMLGLSEDERAQLEEIISHPHGMVLVVGPTGSGKSTTLYSILNALNNTTRKILTLEDPVEFDIPGVTQIPVDTKNGQTFADNVRTIMRLDPDVVMVGEIRDEDTARTAIQAAITGHLLLATFHAQDAAAAFARMIDMIGINPVFATAIRLVISQRLVRKLDDETKIEYEPSEAEKRYVRESLQSLPESVEKPDLENFKLWKPGTSEKNPFGYKGRTVLMEQMIVDDKIQAFLRGDEREVNSNVIAATARDDGMVTMLEKGVLKALRGETTLDEIMRAL